jgi:hypothetical protein
MEINMHSFFKLEENVFKDGKLERIFLNEVSSHFINALLIIYSKNISIQSDLVYTPKRTLRDIYFLLSHSFTFEEMFDLIQKLMTYANDSEEKYHFRESLVCFITQMTDESDQRFHHKKENKSEMDDDAFKKEFEQANHLRYLLGDYYFELGTKNNSSKYIKRGLKLIQYAADRGNTEALQFLEDQSAAVKIELLPKSSQESESSNSLSNKM